MRFIWYSSTPECHAGYGVATRELVPRFLADGHEVFIATKHMLGHAMKSWNGVLIMEGTNIPLVNRAAERWGCDWIISCFDAWQLTIPLKRWAAHSPIDTEWVSPLYVKTLRDAEVCLAMSRHGERELAAAGLAPLYAPLGVDTAVFRPKPQGRKAFRESFGWDESTFVVGSVGLNYPDDRKGFIPLLIAFAELYREHPEARLYLHTKATDEYKTKPYDKVAAALGIAGVTAFCNQDENDLGLIGAEHLADCYNGMDVFCLPSKGEGFGLPLLEAQACGVPVATTASTTGPELTFGGWPIHVDKLDDREFVAGTWRMVPRPRAILSSLQLAYEAWAAGDASAGEWALDKAPEYDWSTVYGRYWRPVLKRLEELRSEAGKARAA